jgi:hypothetical protein
MESLAMKKKRTSANRTSLRVIEVRWVRGPPSPLWTELFRRLLAETKKERPAGQAAKPQRGPKEDTND